MLTPDDLRRRMTSVNMMFFMGGPKLGEVEAGAVAKAFGARFAVASGGILCVLAAGFVALISPKLRRYRGVEATRPGSPGSKMEEARPASGLSISGSANPVADGGQRGQGGSVTRDPL